jgi:hypothetical protein
MSDGAQSRPPTLIRPGSIHGWSTNLMDGAQTPRTFSSPRSEVEGPDL